MNKQRYHRQLGIIDPERLNVPILVIGAGSVGSFVVMSLAKMGCNDITVFDFDTVEDHNMPNQLYRISDIGKSKVIALKEIVKDFTGIEINAVNEKFDFKTYKSVTIVAVDSMSLRKDIWDKAKRNININIYIEARMGKELMYIYSLRNLDRTASEEYDKFLYSDEETAETPCTERAIVYNMNMIAGFIANMVKKYANLEENEIPFEIIFDCKTMYYNTRFLVENNVIKV